MEIILDEISKDIRKKALLLFKKKMVRIELETDKRIHFFVEGETDTHSVIFDKERKKWECDCEFSTLKHKPCSHIVASYLFLKSKS